LQVAEEAQERGEFQDGIYFVELAPISDPELVVPTIAKTLELRESPPTPLLSTLKEHLREKSYLLLLDNFEQVRQARPMVLDLLAECPHLKVLVTSREPLRVHAERQLQVPSLALPEPGVDLSPSALQQYPAVALFVQRARALEPDFELTDNNAQAVVEICRRVDGLPLAIKLVASRVRLLHPQAILARLGHPLRLLTGGEEDDSTRHHTLRDTIEWSYNLLTEREQRLFRCLSVFVGGWTIRAAEAVCNEAGGISIDSEHPSAIEVLDGLQSLVDKSLVHRTERDEEDSRLAMLQTVREYALEELEASGEAEEMRQRQGEYYLALAERAEPELAVDETLAVWTERLWREYDNLRATLEWFLKGNAVEDAERALRLLTALRLFWIRGGHHGDVQDWLQRALARSGSQPTPLKAKALNEALMLAWMQSDYERARALGEEALSVSMQLGDKARIASTQNRLGIVMMAQGDYDSAGSLFEASLATYRELSSEEDIPRLLINLGEVARYQGAYEQAATFYQEALDLSRAHGWKSSTGVALNNLGHVAYHLGDLPKAKKAFLEALPLFQERKSHWFVGMILASLAGVDLAEGNEAHARSASAKRATRLLGVATILLESVGTRLDPLDQVEYDHNVADARARLGDEAFATAWEQGRALTLDEAVSLAMGEGQPEQARDPGEALRSDESLSGLTARESEVAALVAEGLSNRAIGERLILSTRTVDMHVRNALHKLGLASRVQLAAWAVRHGLASEPPDPPGD
jgi:non-specific serine/threonine protein kinase